MNVRRLFITSSSIGQTKINQLYFIKWSPTENAKIAWSEELTKRKSEYFNRIYLYCQYAEYWFHFRVLFLTKLRRFCKPFQVLCYSSGIMAAKDLQWDFFKMIIPCRDQKILELKLGPEKDTILHLAVKANDPALIENMLVCYGIPTVLNLQNRDRKSVLELAVERGYAVSRPSSPFLVFLILTNLASRK